MRSSELASLAGVTVRTLRHYHQVGVLPEAERGSNGYRDYTVHDLVRLLRIKHLAALGLPLERMPAVLDTEAADHVPLLDELEGAIDAEMARLASQRDEGSEVWWQVRRRPVGAKHPDQVALLASQRDLIRVLRANRSAPDLPPDLAPFVALLATGAESSTLARIDRDQSVLLAHLVGEAGMPQLVSAFELLSRPGIREAALALSHELESLADDADDSVVDALVDRYARWSAPLVAELGPLFTAALSDEAAAERLLLSHSDGLLNAAQRSVFTRLAARFPAEQSG
jgi:DNA-binding transcriptional MerR regulator